MTSAPRRPQLLNRNAAAEYGRKLLAALQQPEARFSANAAAAEAAAVALARMVLHRAASVDGAAATAEFLTWLPLKASEDKMARQGVLSLCSMLEANAMAVLGADGGKLPTVLTTLASAYEGDGIEHALSARLATMLRGWSAADSAMLERGSATLQPSLQQKIGRMASA